MLNEGTFVKELLRYTIKARSSSLLIINCNTCTIKSILNRKNSKVNLVLRNMVIIKSFHMNIISKALLHKKGA
jgi:hypothetical protein